MRGRIKVSGGAVLLLICTVAGMLLWGESVTEWPAILPAVALHEGGHFLVARLLGVKILRLRLDLLGARLELGGMMSYGTELLVAMGGPLVNFLTAAVVLWGLHTGLLPQSEGLSLFCIASIGLGGLNLLPVGTMDGGRMLTALLSKLFSPHAAVVCLGVTTLLFLLVLWGAAAYALLRGGSMLSLFVFSLCLLLRFASPDGRRREI